MTDPTERGSPIRGDVPAEALVYRPISVQAIVALAIAGLYGVVVLLGFLAATLAGSPWQMSAWTLLVPFLAVVLALTARARIRSSEGTLAGTALTGWGATLAVIFALIYISHATATYLVLRHQSDTFTRQWFDKLAAGDIDGAYRLQLPPDSRPSDEGAALRAQLENRFNVPRGGSKGEFTAFQQLDAVRLLLRAGDEADIVFRGITESDYVLNVQRLVLKYRVTTPEASFDLSAELRGVKSPSKQLQGRQWYLSANQIQNMSWTPRGTNLLAVHRQAYEVAQAWQNALLNGRVVEAYLATRPPVERQDRAYRSAYGSLPGLMAGGGLPALAGGLAFLEAAPTLCLPGYKSQWINDLIQIDPRRFWPADEKMQEQARTFVLALLEHPEAMYGMVLVDPVKFPLQTSDKGRPLFRQDVRFVFGRMYMIDGYFVLECDEKALDTGSASDWQVKSLELLRFREIPPENAGPGNG
jgi:hypothetical protein